MARGGADGAMGCIPSTRAFLVSHNALCRARSQASCGVCVWALRHRNIGLHYYDASPMARAARHGRNELHARRGGARESVGSAEARVRPSKCPSSALAARARATGNIGFIVRKGRPGKKIAWSTTRNLSRKWIY